MKTQIMSAALVCLIVALCQTRVSSLTLKDIIDRVAENKRCSAVPTDKKFSLEKFVGTWYASYQVNPVMKADPPCTTFEIGFHDNDTISLALTQRMFTGIVLRGGGYGTTPDSSEAAVMNWVWNFAPAIIDTMKVVETDYENYAVVIACNMFGQSASGYVFSRHQVVPPIYLAKGKQVLGSYMDLSQGFVMQTANCNLDPVLPIDTVMKYGELDMEKIFQILFSRR